MLATIRIKNLALVDNIRVEFEPGLNVITGETGAGKSILLGALSLLVGERADKRLIRSGADACGAEALFQLQDASAVNGILEEHGFDPCEDGQLIIRRILKLNGANQIIINDSPATLQVLKKIGNHLVDLHGPHDHQSLLSPEFQLDLLDAFGHTKNERTAYEAIFRELEGLQERLNDLTGDDQDVTAQIDLLSYRVKEIEEADLSEDEEQDVEQEHRTAGNAQRIIELASGIIQSLEDSEYSAFDQLAQAQRSMNELTRLLPQAESWSETTQAIAMQLQELNAVIHSAIDHIDCDPTHLDWLDQRLTTYQKMKRKYGSTIPEILELLETSREKLQDLQSRDEQIERINQDIARVTKALQEAGIKLRRKRKKVAGKLGDIVTEQLRALGFEHGVFTVEMKACDARLSGLDSVEFGFAPNAGEDMKPLRAIASSGEISRVMLACKVVLAQHDRIPLLVFDEIDANVGGETSNAVGRKLAEVANARQVICVTHLPQVAAHGKAHYATTKFVTDGRTYSEVKRVDDHHRVEEVARMLGGKDLTSVTLDHARELIESASLL